MHRMATDASATLKKKMRTDRSVLWRAFVIGIFLTPFSQQVHVLIIF
jgi:hypothetical protein